MKSLALAVLVLSWFTIAANAQSKRSNQCAMIRSNTGMYSSVANYYYDNNFRLSSIVNETAGAEVMPPSKDSESIIYNNRGVADRIIVFNGRSDTVGIEKLTISPAGKLLKMHLSIRNAKTGLWKEYSEDVFENQGHGIIKNTNYKFVEEKFIPQRYSLFYISTKGNIDSLKIYKASNDSLSWILTYLYDDHVNINYLDAFSGDPNNDNYNNVIQTTEKHPDGAVSKLTKYIYEYNEKGYAVSSTEMNDDVKGEETKYTYKCR